MQTLAQSMDEWLRKEAHIIAGPPFQSADCTCVPVTPETEPEGPLGFLITHGGDISYVAVKTREGKQLLKAWNKAHLQELEDSATALPSEYWYG